MLKCFQCNSHIVYCEQNIILKWAILTYMEYLYQTSLTPPVIPHQTAHPLNTQDADNPKDTDLNGWIV